MPIPDTQGVPPFAEFEDLKRKINEIVAKYNNLLVNLDSLNVVSLTADHIDAGTIDTDIVTVRGDNGAKFIKIDSTGMEAFNGTIDTLNFDLATGLLTLISILLKSSNSNERVAIDSTGFHSYDPSGVERITIGTTPAKGAKAIVGRDTSGTAQSVYTYDTDTTVDGTFTGQFMTAHGCYLLFDTAGDVRIQDAGSKGFRTSAAGYPQMNDGFGWVSIQKALSGVSGTVYVSSTSGGPVTTPITFTNGIRTS